MSRYVEICFEDDGDFEDGQDFEDDGEESGLPKEMDPRSEGLVAGNTVPRHHQALDELCAELGMARFSSFIREDTEEIEMVLEIISDQPGTEAKVARLEKRLLELEAGGGWHPVETGLGTVQRLISYLLGHPEAIEDDGTTHGIVWDLRALELCLRQAAARDTRFHLYEC